MPVHRVPGGERDTIYALRSEIDQWWAGRSSTPAAVPLWSTAAGRVVMAAALCSILAVLVIWLWPLRSPDHDRSSPKLTPLMTQPGHKLFPALSPDGRFLAFTWNGEDQDNYDIYVKLLDSESSPIRITTGPALDIWPSWSPDSKRLLFARWTFGLPEADYFMVPALGGPERKIGRTFVAMRAGLLVPLAAWVSGGEAVILPRANSPSAAFRLFYTRLDTLDAREFLPPAPDSAGDCCASLSPDGESLAFVRTGRNGIPNIHLATVKLRADGLTATSPRQLTFEGAGAWDPAWTAGGRDLLYLANREGMPALWRVPKSGGESRFVRSMGEFAQNLSISVLGERMAYSTFFGDEDIWSVKSGAGSTPRRLIASSLVERAPQPSPDGKRIAFLSTRSGAPRIWVSDPDGRNARDIADVPDRRAATPRWSPDGREIAFECRGGGNTDICAVPAEGGPLRRLTGDPSQDILPSWSRDGSFVYFTSDRAGEFRIWKVAAQGEGKTRGAVQLTPGAGYGAVESPDGDYLYYTKAWLDGRVARIPVAGGEEQLMSDSVRSLRMPQNFAIAADGVYYAFSSDPLRWFEIRFSPYAAGESTTVLRMQRGIGNGMSMTPDGRTLLFSAIEFRGGDLILAENFQSRRD